MTDETTLQGGGEVAPVEPNKPPRNDAEAAAQEQAATEIKDDPKPQGEKPEDESRKKNRTREYIARLNRERAELQQRLSELESRQAPNPTPQRQAADGEPTLEQFNFDPVEFTRAHTKWAVDNALKAEREQRTKAETQRRQQEIATTYTQKVAAFADEHPDFMEVVGSIPYLPSDAVQTAIMAHEKGPEIAYHIAQNDDLAFHLASIPPHLAAVAVDRIASRMTAAPQAPQTQTPANPKPVSKAPAPVPTVSGKTPTETPDHKLTDAEWFKRRQAKRRKAS